MRAIASHSMTLLEILAEISPKSSKSTLRSWLKEGRVTLDGQTVKIGNSSVSKGQEVAILPKQSKVANRLHVIYEDEHLVVIDKPAGLLSVATAFEKGETAHALLKENYRPRKVYVVHRLDQDTSGVMVFALSEKAYLRLKETFRTHEIERKYRAIVEKTPSPKEGSWQSYLIEDANYKVHPTKDVERGRIAITNYSVMHANAKFSRVELTLETGRKNQIRVHSSQAGCPIVGDKKYGASADPLQRLCLHAVSIAFKHPVTGKYMRFHSSEPKIFDRLVPTSNSHA